MTIPYSSDLPDAVQTVLGLPGAAGTIEKALLGIVVTALAAFGVLKVVKRMHRK